MAIVRGLGRIHCTDDEIVAVLGITPAIWREIVDNDPALMAMFKYGEAQGKIAIRRKQVQRAMQGSDTMLKHIGKHILGQHDQLTIKSGMSLAERQALLEEVERRHEDNMVDASPQPHAQEQLTTSSTIPSPMPQPDAVRASTVNPAAAHHNKADDLSSTTDNL
jgi:hypothetical protein